MHKIAITVTRLIVSRPDLHIRLLDERSAEEARLENVDGDAEVAQLLSAASPLSQRWKSCDLPYDLAVSADGILGYGVRPESHDANACADRCYGDDAATAKQVRVIQDRVRFRGSFHL